MAVGIGNQAMKSRSKFRGVIMLEQQNHTDWSLRFALIDKKRNVHTYAK